MAVKKGAEGRVYEGMSKKDMEKITLEKNKGGMISHRGRPASRSSEKNG